LRNIYQNRRENMKTRDVCTVIFFTLCVASRSWAQVPGPNNAITDVPGIEVGQYTGTNYLASMGGSTGTTVVLAREGAVGGVSQRGGAPGTRETDLLKPENLVEKVNAVVLSGGSAYGLAAADGVMQCLEAQGIGYPVGGGHVVPIVPAAIVFDPGRCAPFDYRPDASFGLLACQAAKGGPVQQGNVGAGAGTRSGGGVKGGLGTASVILSNGIIVGAIVAVNSGGRTFDTNGNFYAAFLELGNEFHVPPPAPLADVPADDDNGLLRNTTIAVVATNATLTKAQATKVAQMADDGFARAIKTSHGVGDGDTIFALATGKDTRDASNLVSSIGSAAADTLSRAVVHAILAAESIHVGTCNVRSYCEIYPTKCQQ
jgi:L-aminopeptidase/D-esterase-like protein